MYTTEFFSELPLRWQRCENPYKSEFFLPRCDFFDSELHRVLLLQQMRPRFSASSSVSSPSTSSSGKLHSFNPLLRLCKKCKWVVAEWLRGGKPVLYLKTRNKRWRRYGFWQCNLLGKAFINLEVLCVSGYEIITAALCGTHALQDAYYESVNEKGSGTEGSWK